MFLSSQTLSAFVRDLLTRARVGALTFQIAAYGGDYAFWSDVDSQEPGIWRLRERLFVGDATAFGPSRASAGGAWLASASAGPSWAPRDAQVAVMASRGGIALAGLSRASDADDVPTSSSAIGVLGFSKANSGVSRQGWGGYFEVQFESGLYGYGLEVVAKNKGADRTSTPYSATVGTYGLWLPGGGDASYGGAPTNPSNTAIAVGKNATTWNKGIVFFGDGLTRDGSGHARAVELGQYHHVGWYEPTGHEVFYITVGVSTPALSSSIRVENSLLRIQDNSGAAVMTIKFNLSGSAATINATWPTSASGLASGDLWNNNGVLTVV